MGEQMTRQQRRSITCQKDGATLTLMGEEEPGIVRNTDFQLDYDVCGKYVPMAASDYREILVIRGEFMT